MDKEKLIGFLESADYRVAKSYAKTHPHSYTLRENWNDDLFVNVVKHMRKHSNWSKFFKMPVKYFYANGYRYWTMGYGLDQTKLINRVKIIQ
tara:strand:- start:950 stop:1225 length:276 start_codon:yes stop_codon:yes gene_type:complete